MWTVSSVGPLLRDGPHELPSSGCFPVTEGLCDGRASGNLGERHAREDTRLRMAVLTNLSNGLRRPAREVPQSQPQ